MDTTDWAELCYRVLDLPQDIPENERRSLAERTLLEKADEPIDILGMGAAEAAIDLVVRHGAAGDLSEILLRWEMAEEVPPGLLAFGDEGMRKATILAQRLLQDVVAFTERPLDKREAEEESEA